MKGHREADISERQKALTATKPTGLVIIKAGRSYRGQTVFTEKFAPSQSPPSLATEIEQGKAPLRSPLLEGFLRSAAQNDLALPYMK